MLGRATSRIALSVLGVGTLGVGTAAVTGMGGGPPRCAAYTYPTVEACQVRHGSASVCRQDPGTGLWHPDRCGSSTSSGTGSGPYGHRSSGTGWWWWSGGRDSPSTRTSSGTPSTVVGRSGTSSGTTTTSSPSSRSGTTTSSRGGFGRSGGWHSSGS